MDNSNEFKLAETPIEWVANAIIKDNTREFLQYLFVKDGFLYGCNGFIAHKAKTNLDNGFYSQISYHKIENCRYSESEYPYEKLDSLFDRGLEYNDFNIKDIKDVNDSRGLVAEFIIPEFEAKFIGIKSVFLSKFFLEVSLNDLDNISVTATTISCDKNSSAGALLGNHNFGQFLIMGMHL